MSHYVPLDIVKFPRKPTAEALHQRQWKHYKNAYLRQDHSSVTNIAVSSTFYAVTSSSRVRFFNYLNQNKFSLTRFRNVAIGGVFRNDGELFTAGDIEGNAMVFQVSSKTLLRTYVHPKPCYGICFADQTHLATGCDDFVVRYWDLTQKKEISKWQGHKDYVRTVVGYNGLVLSGGMDGKVKIWDVKSGETSEFNHEAPISSIVVAGDQIITAGHVSYKVWDFRTLSCISTFTPHSKNITCLDMDSTQTKLITGSIDCTLKIHNLANNTVEHTIKYPNPILSARLSSNDSHLIVGMADGKLSVRQKKAAVLKPYYAEATDEIYLKRWAEYSKTLPEETIKNYKYFNRGIYSKPEIDELALDNENRQRVKEYDLLLRKFKYGDAAELAFESDRPELTISIIQELVFRNGLKDALKVKNSEIIVKVITWLCGKVHNCKYKATVIPLCGLVIDMYSAVTLINKDLFEAVKKLSKEVEEEYAQQTQALQIIGIIDFLLPE